MNTEHNETIPTEEQWKAITDHIDSDRIQGIISRVYSSLTSKGLFLDGKDEVESEVREFVMRHVLALAATENEPNAICRMKARIKAMDEFNDNLENRVRQHIWRQHRKIKENTVETDDLEGAQNQLRSPGSALTIDYDQLAELFGLSEYRKEVLRKVIYKRDGETWKQAGLSKTELDLWKNEIRPHLKKKVKELGIEQDDLFCPTRDYLDD